jgi:hypothetical protein
MVFSKKMVCSKENVEKTILVRSMGIMVNFCEEIFGEIIHRDLGHYHSGA